MVILGGYVVSFMYLGVFLLTDDDQPNIMVDESGNARITDFGLAVIARNPHSRRSTSDEGEHTGRWCAPEVLKSERSVSMESDVFSFGMVMIEVGGDRFAPCQHPDPLMKVFTGEPPFDGDRTPTAIAKIMAGKLPGRPTHTRFTNRLWELTRQCLEPVPSDRPHVEKVVEALKDMVGSRKVALDQAPPLQTVKSHGIFSRRASGSSPLKQQKETGGTIPHALIESMLIDWQESNRAKATLEKRAGPGANQTARRVARQTMYRGDRRLSFGPWRIAQSRTHTVFSPFTEGRTPRCHFVGVTAVAMVCSPLYPD